MPRSATEFESLVEQQIRQAMDRGEFRELRGEGRPLADLDDDDPLWWVRRKLRDEGLAMPAPPEIELAEAVKTELARIATLPTEAEARAAVAALNDRIARFNTFHISGLATSVATVDPERVLARWRDARAQRGGADQPRRR